MLAWTFVVGALGTWGTAAHAGAHPPAGAHPAAEAAAAHAGAAAAHAGAAHGAHAAVDPCASMERSAEYGEPQPGNPRERILVTGGAGFIGSNLVEISSRRGIGCA